jgi:hypothetical protein
VEITGTVDGGPATLVMRGAQRKMELLRQSGGRSYYLADGVTLARFEEGIVYLGSVEFSVAESSRATAAKLVAEFNARAAAAVSNAASGVPGTAGSPIARANTLARIAQALAWILGGIGVVVGLIMTFQTDPSCQGSCSHPFVVSGILAMLVAAFFAVFGAMVAAYIESRTQPSE